MKLLIVGGAGMIGQKLAARLLLDGHLGGEAISQLTLFDVVPSIIPDVVGTGRSVAIDVVTGDLSESEVASQLVQNRPDVIFHLAAVVSGEAEADFAKGYRINLDGTRFLLDSLCVAPYVPRVVFTSSIAVFGSPFPESIDDTFHLTPLTSYGTQKAIGELLLNDYSRRGLMNGVGIRLPTICVRPGSPNKAASGFFSNIIREPLAGKEAILPVSDDVRHWHASPKSAVNFLLHAATMDTARLGNRRNLTMPGVSVTVGEQIQALQKVAGSGVVSRIRREPDAAIIKMVAGWPQRFSAVRAQELGFCADAGFEDIIRSHIDSELHGQFVS